MQRREYLLALATVGFASGCLGGGTGSARTSTIIDVEGSPAMTATTTPTSSPTASPTPTATPTPTPSLGTIDEEPLAGAILNQIFAARESDLIHEGTLAKDLDNLASYHSDRMAQQRKVAHVIDGEGPNERYEKFDLWCRFPDDVGRLYKHNELELVGVVSTRGVSVDGAAKRLVQKWLNDTEATETLMIKNAEYVGIGVTIVPGKAYVTVVYC